MRWREQAYSLSPPTSREHRKLEIVLLDLVGNQNTKGLFEVRDFSALDELEIILSRQKLRGENPLYSQM